MGMLRKIVAVSVSVVALAGCRTATRVVEEPRVDLDMPEGSNRGYMVGNAPAAEAPTKTTREIVETEVEVPPLTRGNRRQPVNLNEVAPPEVDMSEESSAPEGEALMSGPFDNYVVKKGDTLWSIAADSKVLGDGTKWRALYHINRDVLKTPDRLQAGMILKVPHGAGAPARASASPEPEQENTAYTK